MVAAEESGCSDKDKGGGSSVAECETNADESTKHPVPRPPGLPPTSGPFERDNSSLVEKASVSSSSCLFLSAGCTACTRCPSASTDDDDDDDEREEESEGLTVEERGEEGGSEDEDKDEEDV